MSEQTSPPEETVQFRIEEEPKQTKQAKMPLEELLAALRSAQDGIGQIVELTSEEETLVKELFESLLKLMQPIVATIPVSTAALPDRMGDVAQATIDLSGQLLILYSDGEMALKDLHAEENRDLMISVLEDALPKLKQLFDDRRQDVEGRMKFLSSVTKEIQKMARAFLKAAT